VPEIPEEPLVPELPDVPLKPEEPDVPEEPELPDCPINVSFVTLKLCVKVLLSITR
jgi:hypothetical protein